MAKPQTQKIATPIADVWIDVNQVVHMEFKSSERHNVEDAKLVTQAHAQLSGDKKSPVLVDMRKITVGADKDARNHYASEEAARLKSAMAMVTNNKFQRTLGSIYLFMTRPPYPAKIFTTETDALTWLQDYNSIEKPELD